VENLRQRAKVLQHAIEVAEVRTDFAWDFAGRRTSWRSLGPGLLSVALNVAQKCFVLHNLNATMAIMSGLMSTAVHRLKQTWAVRDITKKKKSSENIFLNNRLTD
jgi:hypothetical protein